MANTRFRLTLPLLAAVLLLLLPRFVGAADSEVCNHGDSWLYMAIMGTNEGLIDHAMIESFRPIQSGQCAPYFPYGIDRVYVAFFKYDKQGKIHNVRLAPREITTSDVKERIDNICVPPQQAFRSNGTWNELKRKFTPPCPDSYLPAAVSFEATQGKRGLQLNVYYSDDVKGPAWGAQYGETRRLQSIWEGIGLEPNQAEERDQELAKELLGAAQKYIEESRRKELERRAQQLELYRRRQAEYEKRVELARKQLERPDDQVCGVYLDKESFTKYEELTLDGVKIGMDTTHAHKAVLCNGFTTLPTVVARYGSIEKYLNRGGVITFTKQGPAGYQQELELETLRNRNGSQDEYQIHSARIRFIADHVIDDHEWEQIKAGFLDRYRIGGMFSGVKKATNGKFIHFHIKQGRDSHRLDLNMENSYNRPLRSYTITLL